MSQAIYPASFAAITIKRAGDKYRPSNGTEGQLFLDAFCRRCQRDGAMRDGEPVEVADDDQRCEIIGLTMILDVSEPEYPTAWQYGRDGQPCCTQFVPAGEPVPEPRCTHTQELF